MQIDKLKKTEKETECTFLACFACSLSASAMAFFSARTRFFSAASFSAISSFAESCKVRKQTKIFTSNKERKTERQTNIYKMKNRLISTCLECVDEVVHLNEDVLERQRLLVLQPALQEGGVLALHDLEVTQHVLGRDRAIGENSKTKDRRIKI
jgi:phenylpropionate dioxygenase-like ring-hydroxylating dioxygenase large terminal subunit